MRNGILKSLSFPFTDLHFHIFVGDIKRTYTKGVLINMGEGNEVTIIFTTFDVSK